MNDKIYKAIFDNINFFDPSINCNQDSVIHLKAYMELLLVYIVSNNTLDYNGMLKKLINNLNSNFFTVDRCIMNSQLCESAVLSNSVLGIRPNKRIIEKFENDFEYWQSTLLILQHYAILEYYRNDGRYMSILNDNILKTSLGKNIPLEISSYSDFYNSTHAIISGSVYGKRSMTNKKSVNCYYHYFIKLFYFSFFDKNYDMASEAIVSCLLIDKEINVDKYISVLDEKYFNDNMLLCINENNISSYYHQILVRIMIEAILNGK